VKLKLLNQGSTYPRLSCISESGFQPQRDVLDNDDATTDNMPRYRQRLTLV
jgi:hypothetical protein